MNILLVGEPFFKRAWQDAHRVVTCGVKPECDIRISGNEVPIQTILAQLEPTWSPDLLIQQEILGYRVFLSGLEALPCPAVWYGIDVHLNYYWMKEYARLFDVVFFAQKDWVERFQKDIPDARAFWLPLWLEEKEIRDLHLPRKYDVGFVGRITDVRWKRKFLLDELSKWFFVTISEEVNNREISRIYSQSKIVFNEAIFHEVNFRVFEAMGCGSLLVSERTTNGLFDLFEEREHLVTYSGGEYLDLVHYYLTHEAEREEMARKGNERVLSEHTIPARAAFMLNTIQNLLQDIGGSPARERSHTSYQLGKVYYFHDLHDPAWDLFTEGTILESPSPDEAVFLGRTAFERKDWENAGKWFEQYESMQPDSPLGPLLLLLLFCEVQEEERFREVLKGTLAHSGLSQKEESSQILRDIQGAFPDKQKVFTLLGELLWLQGEEELAEKIYTKAIFIDPGRSFEICKKIGEFFYQNDNFDPAYGFLEKALKFNPDDRETRFILSLTLAKMTIVEEAARELLILYEEDPQERYLREARKLGDSGQFHYFQGLAFLKLGKLKRAEEAFRQAIKDREEDFRGWLALGHIHWDRQEYQLAERCYCRSLELAPVSSEASVYVGLALLQKGNLARGIRCLERSVELNPRNEIAGKILEDLNKQHTK